MTNPKNILKQIVGLHRLKYKGRLSGDVVWLVIATVSALLPLSAKAQFVADTVPRGSVYGLALDLRPAYVVPSNGYIEGDNALGRAIDKSMSAYMKFSFTLDPKSRLGRMYPQAYQGIGVGWTGFFDAEDMGNPVSVYAFQGAPIVNFNNRLSLDYEWNFGASFGWKKYHEDNNPTNGAVGSSVNAYVNLALMLRYKLDRYWHLTGGIDFTHYSNGNTDYPNSGINLAGVRLGLAYMFNGSSLSDALPASKEDIDRHFVVDVSAYVSARKVGFEYDDTRYLIPGRFGVIGLNINPMYRLNKYFGIGASLDAQYDEGANLNDYYVPDSGTDEPKFYRPPLNKQLGVGASLRAEFTMGFFAINVGLGHNIIYKGRDLGGFYQMFALKTFVTPKLFLNVGYKLLRFENPGNLMLGIGYRFN